MPNHIVLCGQDQHRIQLLEVAAAQASIIFALAGAPLADSYSVWVSSSTPPPGSRIWVRSSVSGTPANEAASCADDIERFGLDLVCSMDVGSVAPVSTFHIAVAGPLSMRSFQSASDLYRYLMDFISDAPL
jgi:hypothetical protein